ncbi:putative outer membrane protein TolC [Fulvivirga imtechensis AK7]|uniref:Putative outer membrane protein TolC n=1 Tax=Fulvivirga imtechensis AK7 TaxID=1237149 RepID=L8K0A0_9BACT|nr:TolC family protein [Fulvivirga imtechensis]ELR73813.1 putative outer membrane protein TolC [Fulvivirga imtechensis AK7]
MRIFLTFICFTFILAPCTHAQEPLTLQQAIERALKNNYSIKIARNNQQIAKNNYTRGNAGFLPDLSLDYNRTYGVQSFEQQRASGDVVNRDGAQNQREVYGAALNWTIFDGFKMFTTYDQLGELNEQSEQATQAQIELLVYNISTAFYTAAQEKERLALYKSNVELSEERLRIAKDKYELGKASKLEYLQAQVDLNADKSAMIRQMETFTIKKLDLMRLMAVEVEADTLPFVIEYTITNDQNLQLAVLLDNMESENAELLALRKEQIIALHNEKITKGDRLPEVGLFANYSRSNFESPAGFVLSGSSDDLTYGLTARWTLFDGFNVQRRIENTKIQYQSAQYQYADKLLEYNTAIKTRFVNYKNSLDLLALEGENLDVAKENNEIAQERYQIGLSNALELRESQINLINAELRYQDAAFAAKQAEVELKYLSGMLSPE